MLTKDVSYFCISCFAHTYASAAYINNNLWGVCTYVVMYETNLSINL